MRNEWNTVQAKCLSCSDQTGRHKDLKNRGWQFYDKTGALSFILVDAYGTIWSIKFYQTAERPPDPTLTSCLVSRRYASEPKSL
jgi:hypothetical protein